MASITPKGSAWEWSKSIWMIWTLFFGFSAWISFWYIAYRTKQKKWGIWGLIYFAAFLYGMKFAGPNSGAFWFVVIFGAWFGGIFHAFKVRKEYLLRLVALEQLKGRSHEQLKNQIELEYNVDLDAVKAPKKTVKPVESQGGKQHVVTDAPRAATAQTAAAAAPVAPAAPPAPQAVHEAEAFEDDLAEVTRPAFKAPVAAATRTPEDGLVDINNDSKDRLAALPKVGVVLAMKAISIRETQGGFKSVEQFVEAVGLKPHVAEQLREHVVIRPLK